MSVVADGPWVEQWLSAPRFGRYLAECNGDRQRALATYEWNLELGHAVLRDVAHFEIALRNAYDQTLTAGWQGKGHWLLAPASPALAPLWRRSHGRRIDVNERNRDAVAKAVSRTGGLNAVSDAVVAELPFGFWRHLTDAAHEQSLWIPLLHRAWPRRTSRVRIDQTARDINAIRNRAAHHEPLFAGVPQQGGVLRVEQELLSLLGQLSPELQAYVSGTSKVTSTFSRKP